MINTQLFELKSNTGYSILCVKSLFCVRCQAHHGHRTNHGLALTPMMTYRPQAIRTFFTKVDCCEKGRGALLMSGTMVGIPTGPVDTILAAPSLRRRANRHQGVGLWRNWYSTPKKSTPMAADDALPLRPTNLQPRGALPRTNGRGGGETHHGAGQGCVRGPPLHNKQGQQEITTEAMTTTTTRIKKRRTTTGAESHKSHDGMDAIPPSNQTRGIIMPPLTGHTRTVRVNGAGCNDTRPTIGPEHNMTTHKIDGTNAVSHRCHMGTA